MSAVSFTIPGDPQVQGRGRIAKIRRGAKEFSRIMDPKESRDAKATVQQHAVDAMAGRDPMQGPVHARIAFVFTLAKSKWKKRSPVGWQWHTGAKDWDNLGKLLCDACNGVVYLDDRQVAKVEIVKLVARQGLGGFTFVSFEPATPVDKYPRWVPDEVIYA